MRTFIYGVGAQGRIVLDILRAGEAGLSVAFVDDNECLWGQVANSASIEGGWEYLRRMKPDAFELIVAVGQPRVRAALAERTGASGMPFRNAVHPAAVVMPSAKLGVGNTLCPGAVIGSGAQVGNHVIVNTGAVVEHDSVVEDFATICPGVQLGGRSRVGRGAFLSTGAVILPRMTIGAGAVVAAGAVVTKPVDANVLAMGVPARARRPIDESFDWSRLL